MAPDITTARARAHSYSGSSAAAALKSLVFDHALQPRHVVRARLVRCEAVAHLCFVRFESNCVDFVALFHYHRICGKSFFSVNRVKTSYCTYCV